MTRKRWNFAVGGVALVFFGVVVIAAGSDRRPVVAANELDMPGQWRWKVNSAPVMESSALCRVMVRHRQLSLGDDRTAMLSQDPLTSRGADEHPLVLDSIAPGVMAQGVVAIDLLDMRRFGDHYCEDPDPLRAKVVLKTAWSAADVAFPLVGHSVRGRPIVHVDDWADGEVDLLTLTTVGVDSMHTYTFFLTVRPYYN